jgi:hypothetical protein
MHESQARNLSDEPLPSTVGSGGPLIVVPAEIAPRWCSGPDIGIYGSHEDYDRACHPNDWIPTEFRGLGWVEVDGAAALDLDCYTQYLRLGLDEGVLYRAGSDEVTEWDIRSALRRVDEGAWKRLDQSFSLASGYFLAFDSAFPGAKALEDFNGGAFAIECELAPGSYQVFVATVDGTDIIMLVGSAVESGVPNRAL